MSFEEVSVAEENVTPPGTSDGDWVNIPRSGSHHMYAWPLHIGSSEVNDVFQQQIESNNTKPFSIEARCAECNETCAPSQIKYDIEIKQMGGA